MKQSPMPLKFCWRYRFVWIMMLFCALGMTGKILHLQLVEGSFLRQEGKKRFLRELPIAAYRGMITDRHGAPLAVSTPVVSVWGNPKELLVNPQQWSVVADWLGINMDAFKKKIAKYKHREFIYLKRQISPEQAQQILSKGLHGVYGRQEYRRFYPAGEVTAQLVGFTNIDHQGQEGLELAYNAVLKGVPGKKQVIKNRLGQVVEELGVASAAQPGQDIALSIDLKMQSLAYQTLLKAMKRNHATTGSIVGLDVETGEVLVMLSHPSCNPNNRASIRPRCLRNRAMLDLFEPGSTIKPFVMALALESGLFQVDSTVQTHPGYWRVDGNVIRDYRNYGTLDMTQVLAKSSNVGISKIALRLPTLGVPELLMRLGFAQETGLGFPGESIGVLSTRLQWRPIEVASLSYGYGISSTAFQLAQAYLVLAKQGVKISPSLLRRAQNAEYPEKRVIDKVVMKSIMGMLESVVSPGGTARRAMVPGFRVAGKTGTVHKILQHGYEKNRYTALFAGFAPLPDPKIVLVVVIDDPQGEEYFGGQVAAPVFSQVMADMLRMRYQVPEMPALNNLAVR